MYSFLDSNLYKFEKNLCPKPFNGAGKDVTRLIEMTEKKIILFFKKKKDQAYLTQTVDS